ncbi:hypothetical protein [Borborobacter arsenicus]|nr:hypothetical protein [Pseudaminobacter arsenicus]
MAKTTKAGGKEALSKKGSESAKHLQTSKPEAKPKLQARNREQHAKEPPS